MSKNQQIPPTTNFKSEDLPEVALLYTTVDSEAYAKNLATMSVELGYAACVNIFSGMQSFFTWDGSLESAVEWTLLFKTTPAMMPNLGQLIEKHHPYKLPAILIWRVKTTPVFYRYIESQLASPRKAHG